MKILSGCTRSKTRQPTSSQAWCDYFRQNVASLSLISWEQGVRLTDAERAAIAKSVQTFQLGESGEGRHLIRAAERYASRSGDVIYVEAVRLFIAEEQRHAANLGRFLDAAGLPRIKRELSDRVFRRLRHLAGLELTIAVLITAEVIALVYYAALRDATGCSVLHRICDQILRDEVAHVRFQSERLALIRRRRPWWWISAGRLGQRVLFSGTSLVVWWGHAKTFRAGGLSFRSFWRRAHQEFHVAWVHAASVRIALQSNSKTAAESNVSAVCVN